MSQPPPTKTDTPEVWPLVVADTTMNVYEIGLDPDDLSRLVLAMKGRDAFGRAKHGAPLRVENGRDAAVDAMEEALDLCAYTRQMAEKHKDSLTWSVHRDAVRMAARVLLWRNRRMRDD